jgi:CubicO group peptidase (beta-lactamase class C family)
VRCAVFSRGQFHQGIAVQGRWLFVCVVFVARLWPTAAIPAAAEPVQDVGQLEERLEQLRRDVKIPAFSAALARGDRIVWAKGFGWADVERQLPATPTTGYHLASLTKTFAATVIMQLVEEGKIDLDAPVSQYGVALESEGLICVKHLLSHTSAGVPGTRFSYDGNRFAELTRVVEKASGCSFGQLVCERILAPLGLKQTAPNVRDSAGFAFAGLDSAAFEANLARGYRLDKPGRLERVEYPRHFNCSAGLISTVLDVARFSMALDGGKLLSAASLERAMTRTVTNEGRKLPYGLGWFVLEHKGVKLVWHYGLWIGNSSLIVKVPERKLTYVILANSERLTSSYFHGRGELLTSPFARAFVEGFVSGDGRLPETAISIDR